MSIWAIVLKEVLYRKRSFLLGILAVAIALTSMVAAMLLLRIQDIDTEAIMQEKEREMRSSLRRLEDDVRKATLKLSFNLVILPEGQDLREWYTKDYASKYMPEEYVARLANSKLVMVRHLLPSLQEKIRWPETGRTIILVGTRGEVPNLHRDPKKPLIDAVPPGTIVLGHELHRSLGLKKGDRTQLLGREFVVHECHARRGNKDDISAWIHLTEAQELLDKKGLINAILALECLCAREGALAKVRAEIEGILPGTRVVERGSEAVARAEARLRLQEDARTLVADAGKRRARLRRERERAAAVLVSVLVTLCAACIALVGYGNVRARRAELGIMRAMGYRSIRIACIVLTKFLLMGVVGGLLGIAGGIIGGSVLGTVLDGSREGLAAARQMADAVFVAGVVATSCALALISGWIPAVAAIHQDPAAVLRGG